MDTPPIPSLQELVDQLQTMPEDVRELIQRLTSLSTAAHVAASTLLEHGTNGLASCDNVDRLYKDVQLTLKKFDPPATKQLKIWSVKPSRDSGLHATHNRRKNGPICMGCVNSIGFYQGEAFLGVVRMIGRSFMRLKAGDLIAVPQLRWIGKPKQKLLTIERIDGLMVHVREMTADERTRATNAQDPVDPGLAPGPRFMSSRAPGDQ